LYPLSSILNLNLIRILYNGVLRPSTSINNPQRKGGGPRAESWRALAKTYAYRIFLISKVSIAIECQSQDSANYQTYIIKNGAYRAINAEKSINFRVKQYKVLVAYAN